MSGLLIALAMQAVTMAPRVPSSLRKPENGLLLLGPIGEAPKLVETTLASPPRPGRVMALPGIKPSRARIELYTPRDAAARRRWLDALRETDELAYGEDLKAPEGPIISGFRFDETVAPGGRRVSYILREAPTGKAALPFCRSIVDQDLLDDDPEALAKLNNWCAERVGLYER